MGLEPGALPSTASRSANTSLADMRERVSSPGVAVDRVTLRNTSLADMRGRVSSPGVAIDHVGLCASAVAPQGNAPGSRHDAPIGYARIRVRDLDDSDDVARFHAAHDTFLDHRRAIFQIFGLDEPIDLADAGAVREVLDRFTEAVGYRRLGDAWRSIAEPQAVRALEALVRFDQAYASRLVADEAAAALVADFVTLFPEPRSWHTIATFAEHPTRIDRDVVVPLLVATGWYGALTGATFDTGLAVLSPRRIGLLWFADED